MDKHAFFDIIGRPAPEKVARYYETLRRHESDKAGPYWHSYYEVYAALFEDDTRVHAVCELGIYHGASLRAWQELFGVAHVIGMDFNPDYLIEDGRITSMLFDQRDPTTWPLARNLLPELDLMIDDATHDFALSLATYNALIDKVRPGGWYVVEDVKVEDAERWLAAGRPGWLVDLSPDGAKGMTDNRLFVTRR